jgi:hypothetical protein
MSRSATRTVLLGTALIGLGWITGRAQTATPEFELLVNAPQGETNVQCVRGCKLQWTERSINPNDPPVQTFTYACRGIDRCSSGRIAGWIVKP